MNIEPGKTYLVSNKNFSDFKEPMQFRVEDLDTKIWPGGWGVQQGNPACLIYAMRSGFAGLPLRGKVYYGKIGAFGHLVHEDEFLEEVV